MAKNDDELQKLVDERDALKLTLEEVRAKLAKEPPAEAGFSMNFTMKHPTVGAAQFTFRGVTCGDWNVAIDSFRDFAAYVKDYGWEFNVQTPAPQATPPAPTKAQEAVKGGSPEAQAAVAKAESVPAGPNGQPWETVDVSEIHIEPKADGLVSVEFWNPGRKYAEEYVKWKPENVKGLLKHAITVPVNDDGSIKTSKQSVPEGSKAFRVFYSLGKEKTGPNAKPGSRWHDVAHVRLVG